MDVFIFVLLFVLGCVVGGFAFYFFYNNKIKNSTKSADSIIKNAKKEAEKVKRESLFETKEEIHKLKLETDKEILPNNGVKILVGEPAAQACYNYSSATSHAKGHYSSGAYNGNTPYYYAATTNDVLEGSGNDLNICYWTLENGNYILISGYTNAKAYFAAHSS